MKYLSLSTCSLFVSSDCACKFDSADQHVADDWPPVDCHEMA